MCTTKAYLPPRCSNTQVRFHKLDALGFSPAHFAHIAGHTLPESRETCGVDSLACAIGNFCKCYAGFIAIDIESRLGCDKFK
jgi:hypothetical protein